MNEALRVISGVFNFISIYSMTLLLRCVLISFPILGIVMLLRGTVLKNRVFWKGAVWLLFLLVPFFGKLRLYYELWPASAPFHYCQWLAGLAWFRWIIISVIVLLLARMIIRRRRARTLLWYTTKTTVAGQEVYLTDAPVSPFVIGLIHPRIILSVAMLRDLSAQELEMILLHERTHIRLKHLWIFLLWDVFAAIFWLNPLLLLISGKLREDMEQICDCVTMQNGKEEPEGYGGLILKSLTILHTEATETAVMFLGEGGYKRTKRRLEMIGGFRRYRKTVVLCFGIVVCTLLIFMIGFIRVHSYPKYEILPDITIGDEEGNVFADGLEAEKTGVVIREGKDFVVDAEKLRAFLPADFPEESYVYFYYDMIMKMPGVGVSGECAWIENVPETGKISATIGTAPWWDEAIVWFMEIL